MDAMQAHSAIRRKSCRARAHVVATPHVARRRSTTHAARTGSAWSLRARCHRRCCMQGSQRIDMMAVLCVCGWSVVRAGQRALLLEHSRVHSIIFFPVGCGRWRPWVGTKKKGGNKAGTVTRRHYGSSIPRVRPHHAPFHGAGRATD